MKISFSDSGETNGNKIQLNT